MPTSADRRPLLVDTSVAVALLVADHEQHDLVFAAIGGQRLGLAGHAAFETFSVLTRLPPPTRLAPVAAIRAIESNFPESRFLSPGHAASALSSLAAAGVAGGAVYDALVGLVAREHELALATRDLRASETYRALEVGFQLIIE